jgi:hypothetical protein
MPFIPRQRTIARSAAIRRVRGTFPSRRLRYLGVDIRDGVLDTIELQGTIGIDRPVLQV